MLARLRILLAFPVLALAVLVALNQPAENSSGYPGPYPGPGKIVYLPDVLQGQAQPSQPVVPTDTPTWTPVPSQPTATPTPAPSLTCGTWWTSTFGLSPLSAKYVQQYVYAGQGLYGNVEAYGYDQSADLTIWDPFNSLVYDSGNFEAIWYFIYEVAPVTGWFSIQVYNPSLFENKTITLNWHVCQWGSLSSTHNGVARTAAVEVTPSPVTSPTRAK